jgi:DNA-directed RNA polymerase subunit N (RpoN/RPB10)
MASYFTCPSCGHYISNIILPYQMDMMKLAQKMDIDIDVISKEKDDKEIMKEKGKILDKYTEKDRYCCRMRLMNTVDIVNVVN